MASPNRSEKGLDDLKEIAVQAGGRLLSKKYLGSNAYYEWECAKGHIWKATPAGQGKRRWCPTCGAERRALKKTLTTKEVNSRLKLRGLELETTYDPKVKLQNCICLVCKNRTKASFARIPKGYGCRNCLRKIQPSYRKIPTTKVENELAKYSLTLLGEYKGVDKPLKLLCNKCGVEFSRSLDNLRRIKQHNCSNTEKFRIAQAEIYIEKHGHRLAAPIKTLDKPAPLECATCNAKSKIIFSDFKRLKIKCISCSQNSKLAKIRARAESKGGELLSTKFISGKTKYEFKCSEGHKWEAIDTGKSWCPKCAGKGKGIDDIQSLVDKRGGKLISKKFIGVDKKYEFECSIGHQFSMTFAKMQSGQWCSICSKGSKSEELVRVTMEQIFGVKFKRVRPDWLKNDLNVPMELDGYAEELGIAFEYQGRQHYEEMNYLIDQDLKRIQKNDKLKSRLCAERGVSLFIFTHEENYRNFPRIAEKQAIEFKLPVTNYDFKQKIDFDRAYIRTDKLQELKDRAGTKGLMVLSKKWLGVENYYQVECTTCRNVYEVAGSAFMGRKINGCRYCSLKTNYNKSTLSIDVPKAYAKKHRGQLLETEYKNMHTPMNWRCSKKHEFSARFNNLVRNDEFCPICEGKIQKNQFDKETASNKFKEFGLELVGDFKSVAIAVPTICMKCKNSNSSRLSVILKGSPPCLYCSGQRIDEKTAFSILKKYGLKPLGKYVNSYKPILCVCLICGLEKDYKVLNVKATSRGCSHRKK